MKPTSYKKYKPEEKLKVYSGAPVTKGFYNRNLNKAHKLYIDDNWKPPKPKCVNKIQNKKTFSQQIENYIKDYKKLKQKYNFQEEKKVETIVIEKNSEEFEEVKEILLNKINEDENKFLEKDYFKVTDDIIDSMIEDDGQSNNNYNNNYELSFLKTTQTLKDYNERLYANDNQFELMLQFDEDKEKNFYLNNLSSVAQIDERNDEQNEEQINDNEEQQIIDTNKEEIMDNNERQIKEKENNTNLKNKNIQNNRDEIIKNEEEENEDEEEEKKEEKENKLKQQKSNKDGDLINEQNNNFIQNEGNIEYPLFESIIKSDYKEEYNPKNYFDEKFMKKLEEINEIEDFTKKIKEEIDDDENYENEFDNQEENSQYGPKIISTDNDREQSLDYFERENDFY